VLEADVPHISVHGAQTIEEMKQFGPHEVMGAASVSSIPLVGVALEVFNTFQKVFSATWTGGALPARHLSKQARQ
jgi:hypothetical protein